MVFFCHKNDLLGVQSSESKHSNLLNNVTPITRCTCRMEKRHGKVNKKKKKKSSNLSCDKVPFYFSLVTVENQMVSFGPAKDTFCSHDKTTN